MSREVLEGECPACEAGTHPFECFVCEHPGALEHYKTKATQEEVAALLMMWKLCTKDAQKIDAANTQRQKEDIEKAVA